METFQVTLNWAKLITPKVLHLAFARTDKQLLDFIPGQFITFLFTNEEGKIIRRSYSLATIKNNSDEIEVAVSPVEGGFATNIFFNLKAGAELTCSGPFGRLILKEEDEPQHVVLVATGTGVSPYRAMLPELQQRLQNNPDLLVTVLLGVQYREDLLYLDDFIQAAKGQERLQFRAYLSREKELTADYEYAGYVQAAFDDLTLDPDTDMVFLCGNPNMIDDAFELLQEAGFPTRQIKREKYISSK